MNNNTARRLVFLAICIPVAAIIGYVWQTIVERHEHTPFAGLWMIVGYLATISILIFVVAVCRRILPPEKESNNE